MIKKKLDELLDAIECNTETEWQEEAIKKALLNYLAAVNQSI